MRIWPGFFDVDDQVRQLSDPGDQLEARGGQDNRFRLSWPGGGKPLANMAFEMGLRRMKVEVQPPTVSDGHFVTGPEAFWE
ncbi:MAG: hypothetical protein ACLQFI_15970 [Methylocella sp.]